eukprot:320723-Amphidinium_carterae.1
MLCNCYCWYCTFRLLAAAHGTVSVGWEVLNPVCCFTVGSQQRKKLAMALGRSAGKYDSSMGIGNCLPLCKDGAVVLPENDASALCVCH